VTDGVKHRRCDTLAEDKRNLEQKKAWLDGRNRIVAKFTVLKTVSTAV
jgi:hypothetical protein